MENTSFTPLNESSSHAFIVSTENLSILSSLGPTESPVPTYIRDENLAIVEIVTLSAIFMMIVFGNTSVLLALILSRIKLRRMYFFLLHLSIADLITAFANVLPQLIWEITEHFYGGNLLCKSIKYLQLLGPYLSSFTLCATAVDRYQAICFPLESRSRLSRSHLKVSIAWALACLCCLPQVAIFSYREIPNHSGVYECWGTFIQPWGERVYVTWYAISSFFIPFVILVFTFSNICAELWRNGRRIKKAGYKPSRLTGPLSRTLVNDRQESVCEESLSAVTTTTTATVNNARITDDDTVDHDSSNGSTSLSQDLRSKFFRRISFSQRNSRLYNTKKTSLPISSNNPLGLQTTASSSVEVRSTSDVAVNSSKDQWTPRSHSTAYFSKAKIKTIKLTVTIIICYICCSSPFNIVQIWAYWFPGAQESSLWRGSLITIAMLLPSLNSCVNPWIYLFFNRNLLEVLEKCCCSCSFNPTPSSAHRKHLEDSSVNVGGEAHGSSMKRNGSKPIFSNQKAAKNSEN